jgi:hypothetical protein
MKAYQIATLTLLAAGLLLGPAEAARRKSDKGPHPLKILKVVQDGTSTMSMNGCSGRYHVWMQNTTDVAVDKVEIEMEVYSKSGRLEDTIKKDLGTVEAGQKTFADLRYNIVGETTVKPRFWVKYNAGKEKLTEFEIDGPSWNF